MVDTRQFASQPRSDLLGRDGTLQANEVLQGRYRVIGVLGVGGMGAVYQARDLQFPEVERYVAIKEMHNLGTDEQLRKINIANFEREANLLATLSHPAIPAIYDYFSIKNHRSYLVMEYIDGKDLEDILNSVGDSLPIDMIVEWAIGLCDVLDYLHRHRPPIIFRDVKPANIMIDQYSRLRLIDFGIARTFQVGQKGTMIGTEGYSAPEQYKGEASPSSDIYGVGATLHHILTNHDPRLEPPFSFMDRPIREANPEVSAELETIVLRALAFDASQRFPTMGDMKNALDSLRGRNLKTIPSMGGATVTDKAKEDSWEQSTKGLIDIQWKFKAEEEIRSSPTVYRGNLYVGSYDNNLYALKAADGGFLWKYATEGGIATSPRISTEDHLVIFGSDDGNVYGLDMRSGRPTWVLPTKGPVRSSPMVAHGHVFVGSDDGTLYAARVITGRVVWRYEVGYPIRCQPAIADELIVFGVNDGDVAAVDMSGQLKWRFRTKRSVMSTPLVYNGLVYVGSMDWVMYALDANSGMSVWQYRTEKPIISSPVLAGKNVVFGSADGRVYAVDAQNGKERWRFETEGQVTSSPAYHNESIYIGGIDGYIYCLNGRDGSLRWKYQTGGPVPGSPCIDEDMVYIGSTDHYIYALKA
jgi:outer membrane protein assembly factor BamB/tRNA A-37 threonylcarbamoyl transferase component Bud32